MKQMKKVVALVLSCVTVGTSVMLFGCKQDEPKETPAYTVEKNESRLLVVKSNETKEVSFFDVMKELEANKTITMEYSMGEWGAFISSINGTAPSNNLEYWGLYTSLTTIDGDDMIYSSSEWGSYSYNGVECGMANVGASSLPMVEGCYYVFYLPEIKLPDYELIASTSELVVIKANKTELVSLFDVMKTFVEQEKLTMEYSMGDYGAFISSINGNAPEGNAYWALYTSLTTIDGDEMIYSSTEWGSYDYNGMKLGSANVGASSLPMVAGHYYVFTVATW